MSRKRYVIHVYTFMGSNNNLIMRQSCNERKGVYVRPTQYLSL